MTNQHPITPPMEMIEEWYDRPPGTSAVQLAAKSAQWGADQELEATLGLMETLNIRGVDYIRNVRRPKPPSLKERALEIIQRGKDDWQPLPEDWDTIRKALEALPND